MPLGENQLCGDFLRDVAANLNRVRHGHKFSKNTKSYAEAMKIYGGRHMCDLFALNYVGPSYSSIKRENKKGLNLLLGNMRLYLLKFLTSMLRQRKHMVCTDMFPLFSRRTRRRSRAELFGKHHLTLWLDSMG